MSCSINSPEVVLVVLEEKDFRLRLQDLRREVAQGCRRTSGWWPTHPPTVELAASAASNANCTRGHALEVGQPRAARGGTTRG